MQTLFESQTNMAFPWYWPEDEQLMTPITLGPYHPSEVAYAECLDTARTIGGLQETEHA